MMLMEILKTIILGVVQGITEWLPISSTGHMLIVEEFLTLDVTDEFKNVFFVLIQLGSILAVLVLFFEKINPFSHQKNLAAQRETFSLWKKVIVAAVPAAVVGLLLDDTIDAIFSANATVKVAVVASTLIGYGILFLVIESRPKTIRIHQLDQLNYKTAIGVGLFQMLSLIPGTSRSGSTILGATLLGVSRVVSAEFSFFLAIPMMFGASGVKLLKFFLKGMSFTAAELVLLFVGTVISFVVSVWAIRFLLRYLKSHDFKVFAYYRIAVGVVLVLYFWLVP